MPKRAQQYLAISVAAAALVITAAGLARNSLTSRPAGSISDEPVEFARQPPNRTVAMSEAVAIVTASVSAFATVFLTVLTWQYVKLTHQMAQVMESAREPFVDIELDFPNLELRLAFVNAGGTAARDITFKVDQDCELIQGFGPQRGIAEMDPIENGISYLPAGQRLIYSAGTIRSGRISPEAGRFLQVTISYQNDGGRVFSRTVGYDLKQLDNLLFETFHNTHIAVARAIRDAGERISNRGYSSRLMNSMHFTWCPYCREKIAKKAKKCRHCHEWLEPDNEAQQRADGAFPAEPSRSPPGTAETAG